MIDFTLYQRYTRYVKSYIDLKIEFCQGVLKLFFAWASARDRLTPTQGLVRG